MKGGPVATDPQPRRPTERSKSSPYSAAFTTSTGARLSEDEGSNQYGTSSLERRQFREPPAGVQPATYWTCSSDDDAEGSADRQRRSCGAGAPRGPSLAAGHRACDRATGGVKLVSEDVMHGTVGIERATCRFAYASSVRSTISRRNCQPSKDSSIRPNCAQVKVRPSITITGSGSGSTS